MITSQELADFSKLSTLERQVYLRIKQVMMLNALGATTPIVREMLCRAIAIDTTQAELALLAARQMCEDKTVRSEIDDLLQFASRVQNTLSGKCISDSCGDDYAY